MKYFENLPKKSFNSTIGTFTISSFFTYIDSDSLKLSSDDVNLDTKTTLLEAAYNIYEDANTFWTFLLSNNYINPFDLVEENTELFRQKNEEKINFVLYGNVTATTSQIFPKGSIIVPFIGNTGNSASWSSVGNFDLNGPLALMDETFYYDGNMVIKGQKGSTADFIKIDGITGTRYCVITPSGSSYTISKNNYIDKKVKYLNKIQEIRRPETGEVIIKGKNSSFNTIDKLQPKQNEVVPTEEQELTVSKKIDIVSKNIKTFRQSELGALRTKFITLKYS